MMIKCYMRAIRGEPLNESGARRAVSGGSGGWGAGVAVAVGGEVGAGGRVGAGGGDQESLRWEKAAVVRGRELNMQQLCPDSLTLRIHALNVPPEVDRKMA